MCDSCLPIGHVVDYFKLKHTNPSLTARMLQSRPIESGGSSSDASSERAAKDMFATDVSTPSRRSAAISFDPKQT